MKTKRLFSLLLSCLFVLCCFTIHAKAAANPDSKTGVAVTRATGQFETGISANSILPISGSVLLDSGEIVTYNCTYTPQSASIKFGYLDPDGLFCGIEGAGGSINNGIRVSKPGSYTLAIWNKSNETVTVKGTVNY